MTLTFTILGQCKSGKNRVLITRTGHRYPPKAFAEWRDDVVKQMRSAWGGEEPLNEDVTVSFNYFPGDLRRRDVPGMIDAIFHCFERANVITDDTLFKNVNWNTRQLDRQAPRVEVEIKL